jgi:lysophospholipase L1-like esterase
MAQMIADDFKHIDVMTILIGFNDYNGEGVDLKTYKNRYEKVLKTIRSKHPNTKIYCITMTYTTQLNSKKTGIPAEGFRRSVREVVNSRQKNGDKNIYLIEGEKISSEKNLKDKVHFSIEGAKNFANALYLQIK